MTFLNLALMFCRIIHVLESMYFTIGLWNKCLSFLEFYTANSKRGSKWFPKVKIQLFIHPRISYHNTKFENKYKLKIEASVIEPQKASLCKIALCCPWKLTGFELKRSLQSEWVPWPGSYYRGSLLRCPEYVNLVHEWHFQERFPRRFQGHGRS